MTNSEKTSDVMEDPARLSPPERTTVSKPWGGFDQFTLNEQTTVKILTVLPHEELSLQSHEHRNEWWIVLDTKMEVEIDGKHFSAYRGQDVFIPKGAKHRVIGLDSPCRWLEIAFGNFDEEDIHRYEDKYGRVNVDSR
jgi:mannose-6-phosphate isomerase